MKKLLAILSVMVIAACTTVPPAYATSSTMPVVCGPRTLWVEVLEGQFNMKRVGIGILGSKTGVIELYQSPDKYWMILVTDAKKLSCLIYGGSNWERVEPLKAGASYA